MDAAQHTFVILVIATFLTFKNAESDCFGCHEVSLDEIQNDICYFWWTKEPNFWATSSYRRQLEDVSHCFLYEDGRLLSDDEIIEKCSKYPKSLLNPEVNSTHYEVCHYAKYGLWSERSENETESKERLRLLEKFVILGSKRINHKQTETLCFNYDNMDCPECAELAEQMCFFAVHGIWKDTPPSVDDQAKFFKVGKRWIDWQEIWNKCDSHYMGVKCLVENVHYPVPQKTSTLPSTTQSPHHRDCCEQSCKCCQSGSSPKASYTTNKLPTTTQQPPTSTPTPELPTVLVTPQPPPDSTSNSPAIIQRFAPFTPAPELPTVPVTPPSSTSDSPTTTQRSAPSRPTPGLTTKPPQCEECHCCKCASSYHPKEGGVLKQDLGLGLIKPEYNPQLIHVKEFVDGARDFVLNGGQLPQ